MFDKPLTRVRMGVFTEAEEVGRRRRPTVAASLLQSNQELRTDRAISQQRRTTSEDRRCQQEEHGETEKDQASPHWNSPFLTRVSTELGA